MNKRIIRLWLNKFRFYFLLFFYPSYILKKIAKRKGECKNYGICCGNCKYLISEDGKRKCSIRCYEYKCEYKRHCTVKVKEKLKSLGHL